MKTIKVKDLMAIAGKGGLFKYLAQARNGVVVESLVDKKRTVAPPSARVSALEDISIFTEKEDVILSDVLLKIHEKENGGQALDSKSTNEELKKYFIEILPDYDEERVYISDIKKILTWYNQLQTLGLLEIVEKEEKSDSALADEKTDEAEEPKQKEINSESKKKKEAKK
jgi:hypothetical protein